MIRLAAVVLASVAAAVVTMWVCPECAQAARHFARELVRALL